MIEWLLWCLAEHGNEEVKADQKDIFTYAGQAVRLRCTIGEKATVHWSREEQPLPPGARIVGDYLEIPRARPEDSGRYICQVQTPHGVSSDYINLNVSRKLELVILHPSCMVFFFHSCISHIFWIQMKYVIELDNLIKELRTRCCIRLLLSINHFELSSVQFSSVRFKD